MKFGGDTSLVRKRKLRLFDLAMVFEERTADGRLDVARYVFQSKSTLASALAAFRRFGMLYIILAQLSVILSMTETMESSTRIVFPMAMREFMRELWQKDPKCVAFAVLLLSFLLYRSYPVKSSTESFLIMRSLGVQTISRGSSRFIPTEDIQDIIIHEGFVGFEVRFYLAVLLKKAGPMQIEIVFPDTLPRRRALETVWRGARQILFDCASEAHTD